MKGTYAPTPADGSRFFNLFICFHDIRDAKMANEQLQAVNPNWTAHFTNQPEYAYAKKTANGTGSSDATSFYDGQVIFTAQYEGLSSEFSHHHLLEDVRKLAASYGDVLAVADEDGKAGDREFRVEYYSIKTAKNVVQKVSKLNPAHVGVSNNGARILWSIANTCHRTGSSLLLSCQTSHYRRTRTTLSILTTWTTLARHKSLLVFQALNM